MLKMGNIMPNEKFFEGEIVGNDMELDLFCPSLALAFEYQGPQHYGELPQFTNKEMRKNMDEAKKGICERLGITLIDIPYWKWKKNEKVSSLYQSFKLLRRFDLETNTFTTRSKFKKTDFIQNVQVERAEH